MTWTQCPSLNSRWILKNTQSAPCKQPPRPNLGTHTTTAREGQGSSPGAMHTAKAGQDGFTPLRQSHHARHGTGATGRPACGGPQLTPVFRMRQCHANAHQASVILLRVHMGPAHAQALCLLPPAIRARSSGGVPATCTYKNTLNTGLMPSSSLCAKGGGGARQTSQGISTPSWGAGGGGQKRPGPLHSHPQTSAGADSSGHMHHSPPPHDVSTCVPRPQATRMRHM